MNSKPFLSNTLSNCLSACLCSLFITMLFSCNNSSNQRSVIKEEPGKIKLLNDPIHTLRNCNNTNKIIAIYEGLRADFPEDSLKVEIYSGSKLLSKYKLSLLNSMYRNNMMLASKHKYIEQPIYYTIPMESQGDTLPISITVKHPENKIYTKQTQILFQNLGDTINYHNYDQSKPAVKFEHRLRLPAAKALRKNTSYHFGQDIYRKIYRNQDSIFYKAALKNPVIVDKEGNSNTYQDPKEIIFSYPLSLDLENYESTKVQNKPVGHAKIKEFNQDLVFKVSQKTDPKYPSYPAYIFYSRYYACEVTGVLKSCNKIDTLSNKKYYIPEQLSTTFKVDSTSIKQNR